MGTCFGKHSDNNANVESNATPPQHRKQPEETPLTHPTTPTTTAPQTQPSTQTNPKPDPQPEGLTSHSESHNINNSNNAGDQQGAEDEEDDGLSIYEGIEDQYDMDEEEIGSGGYSVVKAAKDLTTGEMVAVKIIDLSMLESEATAGIDPILPLKREISILKRIDHPNIIKLHKVFVDEEFFYIVMELMPNGEELFRRIESDGGYPEKTASSIFRQLVSAVDYLHTVMGVAHRDLKPENVLVRGDSGNEVIKLADFGFAKHFKEEQLKTALGSPAYAAPELFTAESYNEAVDMWSLGVILYLLLSGAPTFYGDTIKELTDRIINVEFDFDDPIWDNISEDAKDVVCRLLVKDPSKRLKSSELKENLWVKGLTEFTR